MSVATMCFILGLICMIFFAYERSRADYLEPNAQMNAAVIDAMKGMIRSGCFRIIPLLSFLLCVNSLLVWFSERGRGKQENKV
jgi:hypothetical protein